MVTISWRSSQADTSMFSLLSKPYLTMHRHHSPHEPNHGACVFVHALHGLEQRCPTDFPAKTPLRSRKVRELKSEIAAQQSVFTRPNTKGKAATTASYRVSHVLAKHKKSFKDGEVVKEAFIEAADALFGEFKNKTEIVTAIKDMQLSRNTVTTLRGNGRGC
ncbi:general transcription factor II-I repeat domain-containing protein 2A-like [Scomber scombrus]|uniref:General transcription factor II-I repeat domain-containing protein 2A-like n=1 Tax=Scomber scombrus TaxID=13677 RepID=A0AAV1P015_SCOSC